MYSNNTFKEFSIRAYLSDWTLWEKFWISFATLATSVAFALTWDPTNQLASWLTLIIG